MTQIVVDAALRGKLCGLAQPAELLDENGNVLGRFVPSADLLACAAAQPQLSEEEWQRREQETETYSTAEVLAHLEQLGPPAESGSEELS